MDFHKIIFPKDGFNVRRSASCPLDLANSLAPDKALSY